MMVALHSMLEWTNYSTMIKLIKFLANRSNKVVSIKCESCPCACEPFYYLSSVFPDRVKVLMV